MRKQVEHVGRIMHDTKGGCSKGVAGLAICGHLLACATGDCVSAWRIKDDVGEEQGVNRTGLLLEAMRHEISVDQRRVITHLALLDGLVLAAGQSRAAKRRRESKIGVSQINPGVFVIACEVEDFASACSGPPLITREKGTLALESMADVELPAAMALWESVGGLALLKAPCGSTLVLLADGDGQVVRWNLAQHKTVAARASTRPMEGKRDRGRPRKPATIQQESCQYESVSNEGRKFEGIIVERCATLPPATGYGTLKSLGTCGPGEKYAVAALQQAIAIWEHENRTLLHIVHFSAFGALVNEITAVTPWKAMHRAHENVPDCADSLLHLVISLDSVSSAPGRHTRASQVLSSPSSAASSQISQHLRDPARLESGGGAAPACLVVRVDVDSGAMTPCRQLSLFDLPALRSCGSAGNQVFYDNLTYRPPVYKDFRQNIDFDHCAGKHFGGTVADRDVCTATDSHEPVPGYVAFAARCSSVACDARNVTAGFACGTVAVWSASSARLVALLRDPCSTSRGVGERHSHRRSQEKAGLGGSGVTCVAMHATRRIIVAGRLDGIVDVWAPPE